jgi:hypothetical protein
MAERLILIVSAAPLRITHSTPFNQHTVSTHTRSEFTEKLRARLRHAMGQMVAGRYGNPKNFQFIGVCHVGGDRYDSVDLDRDDPRLRGHRGSASPCALGTRPN